MILVCVRQSHHVQFLKAARPQTAVTEQHCSQDRGCLRRFAAKRINLIAKPSPYAS
jgi:hypothetical protein